MYISYTRANGVTGIAELAPEITKDEVAEAMAVSEWKEITAEEYTRIKVTKQISGELHKIDTESISALRSIALGVDVDENKGILVDLETKADLLREELESI